MSENVLAIVPARVGSKGIRWKNFKPLAGRTPVERAIACAGLVTPDVVVTTDAEDWRTFMNLPRGFRLIGRPPELAQDHTPMIDVVAHVLRAMPGPEDQIILLVQPTQPLRKPEHLQAACVMLENSDADSVVSVVEVPTMFNIAVQLRIVGRQLQPWVTAHMELLAARRQEQIPSYVRDGTIYAFYRSTVARYNNIYGEKCVPLIIPSEETCPLDTMADWFEAERRLTARETVA